MITKRTVVDQREITSNGIIQIRFRKELVEDGQVIGFEYHRTALCPGDDLDLQMELVNNHLEQMKCAKVSVEDVESIRRVVKLEHTKDVVQKFKAAQESTMKQTAK